jgi:cytochrome P450
VLERPQRRSFSFGFGAHQCPGQRLALIIASQTILALLRRQPALLAGAGSFGYWPSLNGRIPRFHSAALNIR